MKLAILKIGARITPNSKSISGGEAESIIEILKKSEQCQIDAFTRVLDRDEKPIGYNIFDIEENIDKVVDYDALIVVNGNLDYPGGIDRSAQTLNYKIINNFKGKIFYLLCDPALTLKQIWKSVEKKEWSKNYKKEDIEITRSDIKYVTQIFNLDELKIQLDKLGIEIKRENIFHFDFQKFPLLTMKQENIDFEKIEYDLLYGGTFRNGAREDDMIKYYWDLPEDIKVEMFGKIEYLDFKEDKIKNQKPPSFGKLISYNLFNEKMKLSKSTIIIGDKLYKKMDDLAQRIAESFRIGNLIILDESYDFNHRTFNNEILRKTCYINTKQEAIDLVRKIKDKSYFDYLINLQRNDVIFDDMDYCKSLVDILNKKEEVVVRGTRIKVEKSLIQIPSAFILNEYTLSKISDQDYDSINKYKKTFLLKDKEENIDYLQYPGFVFSSIEDMKFYYDNFYNKIENVFTPPRGNLTKDSKYAFIGIQPGQGAINSKGESCWLIGETSTKMLHRYLRDLNIYSYFSNVYLDFKSQMNKDISIICNEIEIIRKISPNIKIVFMGSYEEYDLIIDKLKLNDYYKIWHPAFLLRSFTETKYEQWKNQLR